MIKKLLATTVLLFILIAGGPATAQDGALTVAPECFRAKTQDDCNRMTDCYWRVFEPPAINLGTKIAPYCSKRAPEPVALPAPIRIEQGIQGVFTKQARVAPLKVTTPEGSTNYFVKMVSLQDGKTVLTFYVVGGSSIDVKMPLGRYRMKYAMGATWYGTKHHFGPDTAYAEADADMAFQREGNRILGLRVELIKQPAGNLATKNIKPDDF